MPIRFRCPSCTKLLGIARRKAGTVVRCPRCGIEVTVPAPGASRQSNREGPAEPEPLTIPAGHASNGHGATRKPDSMPLFERPDFESLLNPAVSLATIPPPEPPKPVPAPPAERAQTPAGYRKPSPPAVLDDSYDLEPVGLVVSRGSLTIAMVVVVVLIGLSFAAGYLLAAARLPAASGP